MDRLMALEVEKHKKHTRTFVGMATLLKTALQCLVSLSKNKILKKHCEHSTLRGKQILKKRDSHSKVKERVNDKPAMTVLLKIHHHLNAN
uniref:Uncharacterized protein n=1 Tax=Romanomermis culicivorax TaxID=13658 RepID=A0A915IYR9_ROMCU